MTAPPVAPASLSPHGPCCNPVTGARWTLDEMATVYRIIGRPRFVAHYHPGAFNWRAVFGETVRRDGTLAQPAVSS